MLMPKSLLILTFFIFTLNAFNQVGISLLEESEQQDLLAENSYLTENYNNFAQRDRLTLLFNAAYIAGGKVTHKTMMFNNGLSMDFAATKIINDQLSAGLGSGLIYTGNEFFIPAFAVVKTNIKNETPSFFLTFKLGYSYGYNTRFDALLNHNFKGGLFIEPGFGYTFVFEEFYVFNSGLKIVSQFGELSIRNEPPEDFYKEILTFVMLGLYIGIEF